MKITISRQRHWRIYVLTIIYQNIIILMMLLQNVRCDWLIQCGNCRCKWNSGKKTADCKNLTLNHVPQGLSAEIQVLDLSYNKIKKIDDNAFVKTELENLHRLFLRNCSMERLHPLSFKGLGILIELDLSNNLIKQLPRDAFSYLIKVRSIMINNNLLETLDNGVIRNLKNLHKIELKENRIIRINTDVFQNVPYLSQIFLNGNQLSFLRKESFEKLKRLTSLSLDSNPWNCTCELQVFRDFALKHNLYTPPTSCYYPTHLRGVLWNDEQSGAFACKPKIIYPPRGASINTSKENVTLICRVHATPNTVIAWDYNRQIYSSLNYQARVHIQLLREESSNLESKEIGRDIFISRLTIIGAEKSDEGIYTCLAENTGGKDEVQMSLLVQKQNIQTMLLRNNIITIICLMVLGLISASISLAIITFCVYNKFKNLNHRHHHHHNHHDGSQSSEDSLQHEKHCQTVNSTVVATNAGNVGYLNHNEISEQKPHCQNKQKTLLDNKCDKKLSNGNGLIIDSRISNLTTDLSEKSKKHDAAKTKGSLQRHQMNEVDLARSNCSINTTSTAKFLLSSETKFMTNMATTYFGNNVAEQNQKKHAEHQFREDRLPEYDSATSIIKQNQHFKDFQPDLLLYKPPSKSGSKADAASHAKGYTTSNQSILYDGIDKIAKYSYKNNFNHEGDSNIGLYGQYNNEHTRKLDSVPKLSATKSLNDYLHSDFIEIPPGIASSSSFAGIMESNSLNNELIQKLHINNITKTIPENIENCIDSVSNTNSIDSNSSKKLQKYQFNNIVSYDDRPPNFITLSSKSLRPTLKQQNHNNCDVALEFKEDRVNEEYQSTVTTDVDDICFYSNGVAELPTEDINTPPGESTMPTIAPSVQFLTNYFQKKELL